jgi:hypothetical protein
MALLHPPSVNATHTTDYMATPSKAIVIGVCALDVKARSRAMQEILTRVVDRGGPLVEVKPFGDKVILDEGAFQRKKPYNAQLMHVNRRSELA